MIKQNYCKKIENIYRCTINTEVQDETDCIFFESCQNECCKDIPEQQSYSCHHSANSIGCDSLKARDNYLENLLKEKKQ